MRHFYNKTMKFCKVATFALVIASGLIFSACDKAENTTAQQSEIQSTTQRSALTLEFMKLMDDETNKNLMLKSLQKAKEANSDLATNPVQSLDDLYSFLDRIITAMPWDILQQEKYPKLYDKIDQSLDYFYFLFDQPLDELEGKGYYYPTLSYHEPFSTFMIKYAKEYGKFLETKESWNDEYYEAVRKDERFGLDKGWYSGFKYL